MFTLLKNQYVLFIGVSCMEKILVETGIKQLQVKECCLAMIAL